MDQRFLEDERFIEEADRRTAAMREVTMRPQRIALGTLLTAVATVYGITPREIVTFGRQRALVPASAMLGYFAHEWSHQTTRNLSRRLQRDPSMISRLATAYVAHRDPTTEACIRQAITARHK